MIKAVSRFMKQMKEPFYVPKSVQDTMPVRKIWDDGIFAVSSNQFGQLYTCSYRFSDINYSVASKDAQEAMFFAYCDYLNSMYTEAVFKLSVVSSKVNQDDFKESVLLKESNDGLGHLRNEMNEVLHTSAIGTSGLRQEKYITISVIKKDIDEARAFFSRAGVELTNHFAKLGSVVIRMNANERLRLFHDFFHPNDETNFRFDASETRRKGHNFKDFICPNTMTMHSDYITFDNRYARVLYLKEYASYIKDEIVTELCKLNCNLSLSLDLLPVSTPDAVRLVENLSLGVEKNITDWQKRQNTNNNFSANIPFDLQQQRNDTTEFLNDLTERNQRMMFGVLSIVITADSLEQLNAHTDTVTASARKYLCQLAVLRYQQLDGLKTALPYGCLRLNALRTLTTESAAVFIPFCVQEVQDIGGIYYGQNAISRNMLIANRQRLLNGNSFILGVSGSGKSFTAKHEIANIMMSTKAEVLIIDPEAEYHSIVKAFGGEVIRVSATSQNHINAMDISKGYGDGNDPIKAKADFVLSLCAQLTDGACSGPKEKSLIDRACRTIYKVYRKNGYQGTAPTLVDLRNELLRQKEEEAHEIALAIELFTDGSFNTFAEQTNVDINNRMICYDIHELGEQLTPIGMLVILDNIMNRITKNRAAGKTTYIFIDEIYLMFMQEYSAVFLAKLWKRVRKYGALCTGITQNVGDLLESHTARTMLSNSEFVVMLNQSASDREDLAQLMGISETQMNHIKNVGAGHGLIKIGSNLVPFDNPFPKNTALYELMTTKPGETN